MDTPTLNGERFSCETVAGTRRVPTLVEDVREGLLQRPRRLPPKYFYDDHGSWLFEAICATTEYYPSRTEAALLSQWAADIVSAAEPAHVIELGAGSARKTRHLLDACERLDHGLEYWPLDVSAGMLREAGNALVSDYPWLRVHAKVADYHAGLGNLRLPARGRRLFAFLGGTIGNFEPDEADWLMREVATLMRPGDGLLLGADRAKDAATLEAAYNDAEGWTAQFNINVLTVLNRELDADFPTEFWEHLAFYAADRGRIEMHLRAAREHTVTVGGLDETLHFAAGETIRTEISRKFERDEVERLLEGAGLAIRRHYEASGAAYSLVLAEREAG